MTHSELNKTGLRVFLVLALCLLVVRGTVYSYGLSRDGKNVCQERKLRSVAIYIPVTTVSYQSYTARCGVLGWGRCKRSRSVISHKWKTIYRWTTDIYLRCCNGWRRDGKSCPIDVNECSSNKGGCQQICNNRRGASRTCSCYRGYKTSPFDSKKCVDINECAKRNGGCSHQCVNFPGYYDCHCPRGFRLVNSKFCRDIDECASNNGNCQHNCINLFGSHRCNCDDGFKLDINGRTCSDIDECRTGHDCQKICNNTLGGYKCSCNEGYQLTTDNRTCTDIDECASSNISGSNETATLSGCHHICTNVEGNFHCSCRNGYVLMYDKRHCIDIDKCQAGNHSCDYICPNSEGSYFCLCRPGYKLSSDWKKCEAIPCTKLPQTDVARAQLPNKTKDFYRSGETFDFECQPGYKVAGNATTECKEGNWSKTDFYCKKTCYPPWTELKRRCYLMVKAQGHRWVDALSQCQKLKTKMVIIFSEEENEFVKQLAQVYLKEKRWTRAQMWLGLRKTRATSNFLWVDGSPLKGYTNWTPGEPNNLRGQELCTEMLVSGNYQLGKWNDVKCYAAHYKPITVCEKPLEEGK